MQGQDMFKYTSRLLMHLFTSIYIIDLPYYYLVFSAALILNEKLK